MMGGMPPAFMSLEEDEGLTVETNGRTKIQSLAEGRQSSYIQFTGSDN